MKNASSPVLSLPALALLTLGLLSCGDGGGPSTGPTPPVTTTSSAPVSQFQIQTLITVYKNAASFAQFTRGTTSDERIGKILLGVDSLSAGATLLDNEALRFELQDAVERINEQFSAADFESAFGETKDNLRRFFNDADNDGWAIDGRHGEGRDWPHDNNGNDPDGWLAQMVVTVTSP